MVNIDIQSEFDARKITIDKVGVKEIRFPIIVEDRMNKIQHTVATIDIFVELPHHHRGTHMSRFLEILNSYHQETLIDNLEPFLKDIQRSLQADRAYVKIKFPYFILKTAPISKLTSFLDYNCEFEASLQDKFDFIIGVTIPITTLCPCSKEISQYGAHNQRSHVTVKCRYKEFIWLEEIISYVESSASCEIYPLLKRVDEKHVTEKAYEKPMFVEDMVRDITTKLINDTRITWFSVESENFESIHNHNAYAFVQKEK